MAPRKKTRPPRAPIFDIVVRPRTSSRGLSLRDAVDASSSRDPLAKLREIVLPPEGVRALGLPEAPPEPPSLLPLEPADDEPFAKGPPTPGAGTGGALATSKDSTKEAARWFEVTVVDAWGEPVGDVDLEIAYAGITKKKRTAADGSVRIDGVTATSGSVGFVDVPTLRAAVRPRWGKKKQPDSPPDVDNPQVVALSADSKPIGLTSETPLTIVIVKSLPRVRLIGMHFDTNKSFLRETAMSGIRKVVEIYESIPNGTLLIVGHTDTVADDPYNLDLSVERAEAVKAYLRDDVPAWEAWFGDDRPPLKKWGSIEVTHMIAALPCEQTVVGFQRFSNEARGTDLALDGLAGPKTRKALIEAYMALEGTSLPKSIGAEVHGCGEFFPSEDTGDNVEDEENRRVEIFCFDDDVEPPVPGKKAKKNEPEYPAWKAQVTKTIDVSTGGVVTLFDVVIPLERDLVDSPGVREEVRLVSVDGSFTRVALVGTPQVTQRGKTALHLFHFHDIPSGEYRVLAKCAGRLVEVRPKVKLGLAAASMITENGKRLGTPDDIAPEPAPELDTIFEECFT